MPHRLDEWTKKVQFVTARRHPYLIYLACLKTETVSNTRYIQEAICERLSRDLGIPLDDLLDELPPPRSKAKHLFGHDDIIRPDRIGPSGGREWIKGE